jgi:hypothetical protein
MNIIFIEGIAGSGKSSVAHRLGLHLRELGASVRWHFGHDDDHPIYPSGQTHNYVTAMPLAERIEIGRSVLERWKELAARLSGTHQIVILEGVFLQAVIDHYQLLNLKMAQAMDHIMEVQRLLESLDPLVIYFFQRDPSAALVRILRERGAGYNDLLVKLYAESPFGRAQGIHDYPGVVQAITATRAIADSIFAGLSMRKIAIENSQGDWERYYRVITDLLQMPPVSLPTSLPRDADMLVGRYRLTESDECSVITERNDMYVSSQARLQLIPESERKFHVLGTRWKMEFETDTEGAARAFRLFESKARTSEVWSRI